MEEDIGVCGEIEGIYDICMSIGFIKNISQEWTPKFNFEIYFEVQNSFDLPSPYQIIQPSKEWNSTINLEGYVAQNIHLAPLQEKNINELCTFRGSIPIEWLEERELTCCMEVSMNGRSLGIMKYNFDSVIGLSSYLPIFSPELGFYLQARIETQLLGIRCHKKCNDDSTNTLGKAVDLIIQENKRLSRKIKDEECGTEIEEKENISEIEEIRQKNPEEIEDNMTSSEIYTEYTQLKNYKDQRIFKEKSIEDFRENLVALVEKASHEQSRILQCNWQKYLEFSLKTNMETLENSRKMFCEDFACEIRNKVLRNKGLEIKNACPLAIGRLKTTMEGFKIVNKTSELEENSRLGLEPLQFETPGTHLIVLVHGYGASSLAMIFIERTIKYLYPHIDVLNSKSNEIQEESTNIESMGRNLAIEIEQHMQKYSNPDDIEISFIGYSLGGVVVRAALLHLEIFKFNMNTFISLSCPHIGHVEHENKLAKVGMLAINTFWHSNVIDDLFLKDNKNQRLSYLYSLSCHSGLSWFKNITLYGSGDDGYVSESSALINRNIGFCRASSDITEEMSNNLNEIIKNARLLKYEIKFQHENGSKADISEFLIGRSSHLAFCTNQGFINCFLLQHYKEFREEECEMDESSM